MLALSRRLWCGGDPGGGRAFLGATAAEQVLAKQCPAAGCGFKVVCFCVVRRRVRRGPTSVRFLRVKTSLLLHDGGLEIDDYGCVA